MIPAYNESHGISTVIEHVARQSYQGEIEIVVTDDGSTDNTWEVLQWLTTVYDTLVPVHQDNAGPGVARNTCLEHASGEIVISLDADTFLDDSAIKNIVEQFETRDIVAVGGNVNVDNTTTLWAKTQVFDYSLSMEVGRMFQSQLNHVLCLSGSFSAFRREVLVDAGGWRIDDKYADDFEVSIRISEYGTVDYAQDAIAYTEAPETISGWWKQRTWWARLGVSTMFLHWRTNFNPSFGMTGLVGMPLKVALTFGFVYQTIEFLLRIASEGVSALEMIGSLFVFGLITTTAFSLVMVAIMSVIVINTQPLRYVPYLINYFTLYRLLHTAARLTGFVQAVSRELRSIPSRLYSVLPHRIE